ncbi:MAG: pyrimidine 5'-nucleotidase [Pseudomonadota bacterium]
MQRFETIETWIFDLDNTLYPPHANLFDQVDQRMGAFISELLTLDRNQARLLQKHYYRTYGTTLRGLMTEHGVDPHAFLDYVHDIDHSPIEPDPALGAVLAELPGRKFVFTNGSVAHAEAVIDKLGINGHFEALFDIVAADFVPKPERLTYESFLGRHDIAPATAVMFEDLDRNLEVPNALGMATVLVVPRRKADEPEAREVPAHVDFVIDDLAGFLVDAVGVRRDTA